MNSDPITEALLTAKNLIRKPSRWIKGQSHEIQRDPDTGQEIHAYCAIGAKRAATNALGLSKPDARTVEDYLAQGFVFEGWVDYHNPDSTIVNNNDSIGMTHEKVLAAFDSAITLRRQDR